MTANQDAGAEIVLSGCSKDFAGGVKALQPTDLTVGRGEVVALLGPSGCGKTTLLRIVAGLEAPDPGGRVRFDDIDVTDQPIERRRVGMVFQNYSLFPNMSVARNIGYALRLRRLPKADIAARVAEVMEMCQISGLGERSIDALSGGQRQRVALARAIAMRPRALLLDEPLSALDAALREDLRDELAGLLRSLSITAVFVTHDQSEAMAIADRVAVMKVGQILQIDTPRAVYAHPADPFVASFVGGANRLRGQVEGGMLRVKGGLLPLPNGASENTAFFVRPEALQIETDSSGVLSGTVERCVFLGDRTRVILSGITEEAVAVDAPSGFEAAPGTQVTLNIQEGGVLRT